jgi:hypothetical protein
MGSRHDPRSMRMGVPVVERTYSRGRSHDPAVTLQIGRPRRVPGRDWACPVRIQETNGKPAVVQPVFGIDSLQALLLALEYARVSLTIPDRKLRFLGAPVEADFKLGQES